MKLFTLLALAIMALAGCSTYQGGPADDYTYSYGNLYGLGPGGPQNVQPRSDIYVPGTGWTYGARP